MSLRGKQIVFTGTLSTTRSEMVARAVNAGAKVNGAVSAHTNVLVAGANAGSKILKAQALGTTVWNETKFLKATSASVKGPRIVATKKKVKVIKSAAVAGKKAAARVALGAMKVAKGGLKSKQICFTGTLTLPRKVMTGGAIMAGARVVGGVSSGTDILVAGPGAGSKMAKALALGVTVWNESQFRKAAKI